jgi:hypothetical protein
VFDVICLCILPLGVHSTPGSSWLLYPYKARPATCGCRRRGKDEPNPLIPFTPNHAYRGVESHDAYVHSSSSP